MKMMKIKNLTLLFFCLFLFSASCAVRRVPLEEKDVKRVITHVAAEGESWRSIAYDYYGERDRGGELAVYNGFGKSEKLRPGTGIKIPLSSRDLKSIRGSEEALSLYNGGLEQLNENNFAEAVDSFRRAIKMDPDLYDAYLNLAVTYQRMSLHEKAVVILKDLIVLNDSSPEYFYALGNSYYYTDKYGSAEKAFRRALRLEPEHLKSLFSLGILYEKWGDTENAFETWKRYLELDSGSAWSAKARSHLNSIRKADGGGE